MPQALAQAPSGISTIGNAVGPAALITTTAERRASLKRQIPLFHQWINALWGASTLLSLALLAFIVTVVAVLLSTHETRIGPVGVGMLLIGLILVASAVALELYEIKLARLTTAGELADLFPDEGREPSRLPPWGAG